MGKALIIAEKPSVARDIAAALGGFSKGADGVFERDDAVISSAVGHLVKLALPEGVDKGWELSVLPVIPPSFSLAPIPRTESQLRLLGKLVKRADVDTIINACDAGREGELIFRYVYLYLGCKKPIKRMWLQSMTLDAIREAHSHMKSGKEMESLFHAALCRSEADWLIGINSTRALTKLRELQVDNDGVSSAGRVQSPTLALMYFREMAIKTFVARDFWEVQGKFKAAAGTYDGKWFDPNFEKGDDDAKKADRLFDLTKAKEIESKCQGNDPSSVTEESKPTKSAPPKLFDLTTLQREANSKFGFSAKQTLDIAQALYETHKVLTYPRTDASALPEDYVETVKGRLATFAGTVYAEHANRVLENQWVKQEKRIFDNSKISDHFAIIPTGQKPSGLSAEEAKIYDMVTRRFIAVFHPAAEYLQTTRITVVSGESFKSQGSVLMTEGWLMVYGREASQEGGKSLCKVTQGEPVATESIKAVGMKTTPPERYTEATLLGAMENAGRLVDDEEIKDALKAHGLGTPATRAATIEELLSIDKQYIRREKKYLVPTQKGMQIIEVLLTNGVEALTSPQMTGEWEHKLVMMEKGQFSRSDFMGEIKAQTTHIVDQIRQKARTIPQPDAVVLKAPCPKCGGAVHGMGKTYACQACELKIWREIAGRTLSQAEVETLLVKKITPKLDGFVSAKKVKFSAMLKFSDAFDKLTFEFDNTASAAPPVGERNTVGACPKCRSDVIQSGDNYACEKSFGEAKACDFKLWGSVASKKLDQATIVKLLSDKKTTLLSGFISKAKKPFSAYLVIKQNSEVGFEFEQKG